MPPRALSPTGLVLVDKPAGPSSFAVVKRLRDRTGARAGHAGTLDPFATGLLLVLLGSATRLAQYLVGLDKRYVTEIDLRLDDGDGRHRGRPGRRACSSDTGGARAGLEPLQRRGHAARARRLGREDRGRARVQALSRRGGRRDAVPRVDDPRARAASLRGRRGDARAARLLGDVRARDRRRARRALPHASPHGRRAVLGRRRRRGADPAAGRGAAVPARDRSLA